MAINSTLKVPNMDFRFRGTITSILELPINKSNSVGDYFAVNSGFYYSYFAWDGSHWTDLSSGMSNIELDFEKNLKKLEEKTAELEHRERYGISQ